MTEQDGKEVPVAICQCRRLWRQHRVDRGNIYLLQAGLPAEYPAPAGYEKDEAFRHALGTIYRFSPKGGEIQAKGGCEGRGRCDGDLSWLWAGQPAGVRSVPALHQAAARVDDFGRLCPNGITFSVSIRDNADNEILRFGGYGNYDCQGPTAKGPLPPYRSGWPVTAGASDKEYVYVGTASITAWYVDKTFAIEAAAGARGKRMAEIGIEGGRRSGARRPRSAIQLANRLAARDGEGAVARILVGRLVDAERANIVADRSQGPTGVACG